MMTTVQTPRTPTRTLLPIAALAGTAALMLMLIGTYLDTPFRSYGSGEWGFHAHDDLGDLPFLVAFAIVAPAIVFGVVVARGLRAAPEKAALRSLIVAIVGAVSIAVAWTGLPVVLAAGAATLALDTRARLGRMPGTAAAAIILATLVTATAILFAFVG